MRLNRRGFLGLVAATIIRTTIVVPITTTVRATKKIYGVIAEKAGFRCAKYELGCWLAEQIETDLIYCIENLAGKQGAA